MASDKTLIILHGWGHDKSAWTAFVQKFTAPRPIVYDLPGFGAEPLVSASWGVPEYAEWVKAKIEHEGHTNVVLLGHSFGGRIAGVLASEQPVWLLGVIFYGAPLLYRPSTSVQLKSKAAGIAKRFLPGLRSPNAQLASADSKGLGEIYRRVVPFDETTLLPKITVPVLLIWGEHDAEAPLTIAEETKTLIPNSRLEILPRAGHNAHIEKPDLFYGKITNFLTSL